MKINFKITFFALLAVTILGCGTDDSDLYNLERFRAGRVSIGASVEKTIEAYKNFNTEFITDTIDGISTPALNVFYNDTSQVPSIVSYLDEDSSVVWKMKVYDENLRTDQGIGVGSALANLVGSYRVEWVDEVNGKVAARVKGLRMLFFLDDEKIPEKWFDSKNAALIDPETKIVSIELY